MSNRSRQQRVIDEIRGLQELFARRIRIRYAFNLEELSPEERLACFVTLQESSGKPLQKLEAAESVFVVICGLRAGLDCLASDSERWQYYRRALDRVANEQSIDFLGEPLAIKVARDGAKWLARRKG